MGTEKKEKLDVWPGGKDEKRRAGVMRKSQKKVRIRGYCFNKGKGLTGPFLKKKEKKKTKVKKTEPKKGKNQLRRRNFSRMSLKCW